MNDPYVEDLCKEIVFEGSIGDDLAGWIAQTAKKYTLTWLLVHCDDGVIWGKVDVDGRLSTSHDAFPQVSPILRLPTIQQLRLFGEAAEVYLWNTQPGFKARLIEDGAVIQDPEKFYDETQWLYGTGGRQASGFTLMTEGEESLEHAVPLQGMGGFRAGLKVRHYIAYDDQGQAYVPLSRLVQLCIVEGRSA